MARPPEHKSCEIELEFGDGTYLFKYGLSQMSELQEKCGVGLGRVFARLLKGRYIIPGQEGEPDVEVGVPEEAEWTIEDLYHVTRLGLIGGAESRPGTPTGTVDERPVTVSPTTAKVLCDRYILATPKSYGWNIAVAIMSTCIQGYTPPSEEGADSLPKEVTTPETGGST